MRSVANYFVDDANAVEVPAWTTFGATLSTSKGLPVGAFAIRAFIAMDNIGNTRFIGSAFVNPDIVEGEPVAFEPGSRRSVILSLSLGPRSR